MAPLRRSAKSAPVSPLASPPAEPTSLPTLSDGDLENGHGTAHDGIYMSGSGMHRMRSTSGQKSRLSSGDLSEPSPYFLPLPVSSHPIGLGLPGSGPSPTPQRKPSFMRRLSSRPSDWVSAAKAKDMSVLDLVFAEAPGRAKQWFGEDSNVRMSYWLGGRPGLMGRTLRDILRIVWIPLIVWVVINLMYFM
jgi:hypothetical protein